MVNTISVELPDHNPAGIASISISSVSFTVISCSRWHIAFEYLGRFFTLLYKKKIVSAEYDDKMIDLLKQQTDTECLPQAIKEVSIAHKTGELDHLYHDGGIVYNGDYPFVVCILTENQLNRTYTLINMRRIAKFINQVSKED